MPLNKFSSSGPDAFHIRALRNVTSETTKSLPGATEESWRAIITLRGMPMPSAFQKGKETVDSEDKRAA